MSTSNRTIFFLKAFSTGIMMPVLSLLLLSRGASLNSLAWIVGVYSLTVVIMEFPSGIFCDLYGRKRTYLISCIMMLFSFVILLLFQNITGAVIGFLIQGFARAFSSGSPDALIIEQGIQKDGETALAKINGEFGILESLGIATGSLFGGLLAGFGTKYDGNLLCVIAIYLIIITLVTTYIRETLKPDETRENSMIKQASKSISYTWHTSKLMVLMLLVLVTGTILFTVETYWQPAFTALPDSEGSWKLGIITCCGFLFTALGSQMISWILTKLGNNDENRWWHAFFLTKIILALCVIFFSTRNDIFSYTFVYGMIYLFLGGSSVVENSLLGKFAPDHLRASIMSLFSLFFQSGALIASAIAGILVSTLSISGLWVIAGCFLILSVFLLSIIIFKKQK